MKISSSLSFPFQFHFTDSVVSFELSLEPKKRKLYSNSSRVMNFRPLVLIFFYKDTYILQYNLMIIWQLFVAKKCVEIFMHQQCKGKEHRMAREHGEKSSRISKKCETWIFFFFFFSCTRRYHSKKTWKSSVCLCGGVLPTHMQLFQER